MKVALKTLGCKVNQADSDLFLTSIRNTGWETVSFWERADVYVINSCAGTREAERKSSQFVCRVLRANPDARVILTGCLARRLSPPDRSSFDQRVEVLSSPDKIEELLSRFSGSDGYAPVQAEIPRGTRARVWFKIQDGCDHYCSYCIVPHLRGPVVSLPPERVLRSVRTLEEAGYREIVLCGINVGYYGKDLYKPGLIDLLERLVRETGRVRFRLSSLEPFAVTKPFIERYCALGDRVCPHFHLPLQSGSDRILTLMNRGYTVKEYARIVEHLRFHSPLAAVTTDLMVGFPGETKTLFTETTSFIREMDFARIHLFVFSPRPGTSALLLDREGRIGREEIRRRKKIILELAEKSHEAFQKHFLGKTVPVLIESVRDGVAAGHSDRYVGVTIHGVEKESPGDLVDVFVEGVEGGVLTGRLI
ncbi:MAG TPA: MiaB/RimO family radical SAM methylthiotransferase [Atribacteraceae bacterium]|nr:MiaB/RimO family radical SAM methylthiotransferase [Atribacteraceae bacterium]